MTGPVIRYEGETLIGGRHTNTRYYSIRLSVPIEVVRRFRIRPHQRFRVTMRKV